MSRYAKFLVALIPGVIAALKVLFDALGDGHVSAQEVVGMSIALLAALAVYAVPNRPPASEPRDPGVSEQAHDGGAVGVIELLLVVLVVVVILVLVGVL